MDNFLHGGRRAYQKPAFQADNPLKTPKNRWITYDKRYIFTQISPALIVDNFLYTIEKFQKNGKKRGKTRENR